MSLGGKDRSATETSATPAAYSPMLILPLLLLASTLTAAAASSFAATPPAPPPAFAFRSPTSSARRCRSSLPARRLEEDVGEGSEDTTTTTVVNGRRGRRDFLLGSTAAVAAAAFATPPPPALALVKGNAPPPKKDKAEKKCTNVEECQEMAERLAAQQDEDNRASLASNPPKTAPGGSRYRDLDAETSVPDGAPVAKAGDAVSIRYKVLKLGKRSFDGLSGEGTVVFSRGYGLEDDETKAGDKTFDFTIGSPYVIEALNDAVPGMAVGSMRRISVLPQMGWRKPGRECDGGPGGSGTGGDLKTDYVVVPTATMVAEEACFDKSKLPFPTAYAQQRRMAQRFDQSLIVEVAVVKIN